MPKSSKLLVSTEEFTKRAQKRYDDTTILMSTIGFYGHSSLEGRRAIRRMNQIHARYPIPNDEFLYVLSTFTFEPHPLERFLRLAAPERAGEGGFVLFLARGGAAYGTQGSAGEL